MPLHVSFEAKFVLNKLATYFADQVTLLSCGNFGFHVWCLGFAGFRSIYFVVGQVFVQFGLKAEHYATYGTLVLSPFDGVVSPCVLKVGLPFVKHFIALGTLEGRETISHHRQRRRASGSGHLRRWIVGTLVWKKGWFAGKTLPEKDL